MNIISRNSQINQDPPQKYIHSPDLIPGYMACPIDLYSSQVYQTAISTARFQFPGTLFFEPALQNWNTPEWLIAWEKMLPDIKILTCIPRKDRTIGRGCYKEIIDCQDQGISTYLFSHDRIRFFHIGKLVKVKSTIRTFRDYARVYPVKPSEKEIQCPGTPFRFIGAFNG